MDTTVGAPSNPSVASGSDRPGATIGRYVIERVLGSGGMGIVYAALDPDLDRRVALKLLHAGGRDQAEARPRLLREARAMAKLSHPNVITVHEVGTDGNRDFVAMELIEGQSVAEWLTRARPRAEVLRVLLAAGRGLAAAHAAGLVHRDFKPHNVLLGRDGRVVVTDFGLARAFDELDAAPTAPMIPRAAIGLDETMDATPASAPRTRTDAGSLSSTLTRTGAMLGTPAYMAPEQFAGRSAGPATDQFAFCVALWEGLAGSRPFGGASLVELQRAVEAGTAEGGGPIPRRFRRILERGLRQDPAARWPSIAAMLAALEKAIHAPRRIALIALGGVVIPGLVVAFLVANRPTPRPAACASAERRLGDAWPAERAAALDAHFGDEPAWTTTRATLHDFRNDWATTWQAACAAPEHKHFHGRVACLDDALDELAGIGVTLADAPPEVLLAFDERSILPAPDGCLDNTRIGFPPLPDDPAVRDEIARIHRELAIARIWARAGRGEDARAKVDEALEAAAAVGDRYPAIHAEALEAKGTVLHLLDDVTAAEALYEQASQEAEEAGHDPVRAMALMGELELLSRRSSDGTAIRKLADQARSAIRRAGDDPVLLAGVDLQLATLMAKEGDFDGAIARFDAARVVIARAGDIRRMSVAASMQAGFLDLRGGPGDDERAETLLREALLEVAPAFGDEHPVTQMLLNSLVWQRWHNGDLEGAHQLIPKLVGKPPVLPDDAIHVRGQVVDGSGPVVGAQVHGGRRVLGDAVSLVLPDVVTRNDGTWSTVTGADGRFELDLPPGSILVAEGGGDLAGPVKAAAEVVITLHAPARVGGTMRITGALIGDDPAIATARHVADRRVVVTTGHSPMSRYQMMTPPGQGDRWSFLSVPSGDYVVAGYIATALGDMIQVMHPISLIPGGQSSVDLELDRTGVLIDVVVRADRVAAIPTAEVHVMPGERAKGTVPVDQLIELILGAGRDHVGIATPISVADRTEAGAARYQEGDVHVRLSSVPVGPITICVIPLAGDVADVAFTARLVANAAGLEATCVQATVAAAPAIQAFVVETSPARRIP